jgi:hypothetical protein
MINNNVCVVFVCDKNYFHKFITTCTQLIHIGKYNGTICLVVGDDLHNDELLHCEFIKNNNIVIKYFPNISFSNEFLEINNKVNCDGRNRTKKFQWHKLHLFNVFFKQWNYIFYIDCGMTIFDDVSPMLSEVTENTLLAHSDAYPTYEWKLHVQFDKDIIEYFSLLNSKYNLDIDYFQTGIMLYDTKIIEEDTYHNLLHLSYEYPICRTNEQGIIALYFTNIKPLFKQIKTHNEYTHFYDSLSRNTNNKYIMLKML